METDPTRDPSSATVEVTRHEERVHIGLERAAHHVVRVRRRIITETRLIEVKLRSEVLDIDWHRADPDLDGSPSTVERIEFVLHGEEPEINLVTVAKERIILHRVTVPGVADVETEVRTERIAVESTTGGHETGNGPEGGSGPR